MISAQKNAVASHLEKAKKLHSRAMVIDTHVDTTQHLLKADWDIAERHRLGHLDLPRLRDGGVGAVFFAIWAPGPVEPGVGFRAAIEQFDLIERCIAANSEALMFARDSAGVREARKLGRIAILIGVEGGYLIEDSLENLRECHRRGATYMTLTHSFHTSWADSSGVHREIAPLHGGLTDFGREVIREMNRLGMMVDVSHVSAGTLRDVLEVSTAPAIATHSSCYAIAPHRRNLTDDQIKAIAKTGGTVQINFSAAFVDPHFPKFDPAVMDAWWDAGGPTDKPPLDHHTPLTHLVDHVEHAIKLVGPKHVGFGSDFDGVAMLPDEMQNCSMLPNLTAALLGRGINEEDLTLVLGENVLRVMDACQARAHGR